MRFIILLLISSLEFYDFNIRESPYIILDFILGFSRIRPLYMPVRDKFPQFCHILEEKAGIYKSFVLEHSKKMDSRGLARLLNMMIKKNINSKILNTSCEYKFLMRLKLNNYILLFCQMPCRLH